MKSTITLLLLLTVVFQKSYSQIGDKMEDYSPVATQWLMDAVGDSGKSAIKSVYLVYCAKTSSKGSGFLLNNGYVITNEHVIRNCPISDVVLINSEGRRISITDIKYDNDRDLALLKPTDKLTNGLFFGDDSNVSVGEIVWTWGFPLGYNGPAPLLSVGYLSGFKAYKKNQNSSELVKHLVVNGAFNSGNSGGPLFKNNSDKIIGTVVNKAIPLFTPFVKSAVDAFANNPSGVIFNGTDDKGKPLSMSESQVVAEIVKSLREMSQVMIGEAISVSELKRFLKENNISEP